MGSTPERFHVRWNEYESSIKSEFSLFRRNGDFFDVTLACGPERIRAHKLVLSAFSPLLCSIIKSVPLHEHPVIYLRGVTFKHLESLLHFMYNGEVSLYQEDFEEFLATAFELEVKGLIQEGNKMNDKVVKERQAPAPDAAAAASPSPHFLSSTQEESNGVKKRKRSKSEEDSSPEKEAKVEVLEAEPNIVVEEGEDGLPPGTSSDQEEEPDMDFEYYRQNKVATEDIGVICMICNKVIRQSYNLSRHFEAYHSNSKTVYECPKCKTRHRTKSGFQGHISKFHKLWKRQNVEMYSVPSS